MLIFHWNPPADYSNTSRYLSSMSNPQPAPSMIEAKRSSDALEVISATAHLFPLHSWAYAAVLVNQVLFTLVIMSCLFFLFAPDKRPTLYQKGFIWSAVLSDTVGTVIVVISGHQVSRSPTLSSGVCTERCSHQYMMNALSQLNHSMPMLSSLINLKPPICMFKWFSPPTRSPLPWSNSSLFIVTGLCALLFNSTGTELMVLSDRETGSLVRVSLF